jgi:hypothetical protein
MPAPKRCIFLAGTPAAEGLKWDEEFLLIGFGPQIKRFIESENVLAGDPSTQPTPPPTYAKWRSIPYDSGKSNNYQDDPDPELTQFLSFDDEGEAAPQDEFLERSMALLDDIEPIHIVPGAALQDADDESRLETTFWTNNSFATTSFTSTRTSDASFLLPSTENVDISGPITDLKRIPNADYISRIQPQTITVNLVVGIIAISPARTVRLRRRNAEMDIIDITVGDETRAGFSISFWLVPVESQLKPVDDLRNVLSKSRTGDVVVVNNVALSAFNGCVYGQSLSRRFVKNSTSISLIGDAQGTGASRAKVERVQGWTMDFVGAVTRRPAAKNGSTHMDALPPDTQD